MCQLFYAFSGHSFTHFPITRSKMNSIKAFGQRAVQLALNRSTPIPTAQVVRLGSTWRDDVKFGIAPGAVWPNYMAHQVC